jgi:hypothetical protein
MAGGWERSTVAEKVDASVARWVGERGQWTASERAGE